MQTHELRGIGLVARCLMYLIICLYFMSTHAIILNVARLYLQDFQNNAQPIVRVRSTIAMEAFKKHAVSPRGFAP